MSNPRRVSEIRCCALFCFPPELESALLAAVMFGAALGRHPNISVPGPTVDDCTLPLEWSQMNLIVFKR